jgi:hypothetical protein
VMRDGGRDDTDLWRTYFRRKVIRPLLRS